MKKCSIILVCLALSGCATRAGGRVPLFFTNGIALTVIHTCTARAIVYNGSGGAPKEIIGAAPQPVILTPIFGDRYIHVTIQSMGTNGEIVGIYVASFYNGQGSSFARTWVVGSGSGGGSDILHTSCRR